MPAKKFATLAATLALLTSASHIALADMPLQNGSIIYRKVFENWTTLVVRFPNQVSFRASTPSETDPKHALIIVSFDSQSCDDSYLMELVTESATPNSKDISNGPDEQETVGVRIDEQPILEGKMGAIRGNYGETDMHSFIKFDNAPKFLSDITNGHTLRLHVHFDGHDLYDHFSLSGSNTSLETARQLCVKYSASSGEDDSHYFDKNNEPTNKPTPITPKSDEQYF